jgi:hypothetical protein
MANFKENHTVLWFKKSLQTIRETRKIEGRKSDKNSSSEKTRVYAQITEISTKIVV